MKLANRAMQEASSLDTQELGLLDRYWRAANYLSVGQIYLMDNPLLKEPLKAEHIKPRLLGHWGTTPGLNFIYLHLNRVIKSQDLNMIYVIGPGHGGPAIVANTYLEGTYSSVYPAISQDVPGMTRLFKQFSFPGGIPSHVAPEIPGSIHEGGELGYSLSHAFGAAFDNPDLIVACVIGDGEAETGPLAASWHSNKFLNPATDGAVLPILHLNGYKIANPCILARIPESELKQLLEGYGYQPYFVSYEEADQEDSAQAKIHQLMAKTLETCLSQIAAIQKKARVDGDLTRPIWPVIVLRTPKGWTGPKTLNGHQVENSWRSHQVPIANAHQNPESLAHLETWMRSYRPEELFDESGRLMPELRNLAPLGQQRMSDNPHSNGGALLKDLQLPDFKQLAFPVDAATRGQVEFESTRALGQFLRDIMGKNEPERNFRVFGPDETASNRLDAVYEATPKTWMAETLESDADGGFLGPEGRVMEILSEHTCQGWLEGYLLTGRHGFFSCYEAFIHLVDSMFNQHAKWLKTTRHLSWRRPIASLNYLLTSHVWRQDNNGFSHQDPGFLDHVANKKSEVVRIYLPPDANCLLSVANHCLRSRNYVNVIVAGKQPALQYLNADEAALHCAKGIGIWEWASTHTNHQPDIVLACAGDVPTLETLACADLLMQHLPDLRVRVVNIVDLMVLQPPGEHSHGLSDSDFDSLFTTDRPVVFAFHGYAGLIHRLAYRRTNHDNIHVRGYKEEGTTTTPFDMVVRNDLDRYRLALDVLERTGLKQPALQELLVNKRVAHREYIEKFGEDMPEVRNWRWQNRPSKES